MRQKAVLRRVELVTVGKSSLYKALARVIACQACSPAVSRSFEDVLVEVHGHGMAGTIHEYVLGEPANCPNCLRPVVENTLVRCEGELEEPTRNVAVRDFYPASDDTQVIVVDEAHLSEAEATISGCERCDPMAEMTFEYILDAVTECEPTTTDYVMWRPAKCPGCAHEVTEQTRITVH